VIRWVAPFLFIEEQLGLIEPGGVHKYFAQQV
jgi:hypothetical protein